MPNFAILRVQKLKSPKSVRASLKHAYREQDTPNADAAKTPDNTLIGPQNVQQGMAAFEQALPEKVRKNAVQCVEYLVTSSPDAFKGKPDNQEKYLADALSWIEKQHGKENVIAAIIHRDEKTPHLSAYVVPKDPDTGRLNCRRFLGGAKALNAMQTDFAQTVGRPVGLQRGFEGSKATHTKLKTYYGALKQDEPQHKTLTEDDLTPKVLKKGIFTSTVEGPSETAARINQEIQAHYEPILKTATVARTVSKELREHRDYLKQFQSYLEPLISALKNIPDSYRETIIEGCVKLADQAREKFKQDCIKEVEQARLRRAEKKRSR